LSALSVLVFGGSKSLKQLAEIEQVKPPTMVRIVQGLVEQHLATTRADKEDARRLQISATARGKAVMQRARLRRVEVLAQMLNEKAASERTEIANAVAILRNLRVNSRAK
jgi:DNA-binding MarR family transcriptional regulator